MTKKSEKEVTTVASATTKPSGTASPKRPVKQPADWRSIAMGTLATFLAIFALLAMRMQSGQDPALSASASKKTTQAVVYRRLIVKRKVIHETIVPAAPSGSGSGTSDYSQGSVPTQTSAPSYSAPAPTYSAPAPAPATRAS